MDILSFGKFSLFQRAILAESVSSPRTSSPSVTGIGGCGERQKKGSHTHIKRLDKRCGVQWCKATMYASVLHMHVHALWSHALGAIFRA